MASINLLRPAVYGRKDLPKAGRKECAYRYHTGYVSGIQEIMLKKKKKRGKLHKKWSKKGAYISNVILTGETTYIIQEEEGYFIT